MNLFLIIWCVQAFQSASVLSNCDFPGKFKIDKTIQGNRVHIGDRCHKCHGVTNINNFSIKADKF